MDGLKQTNCNIRSLLVFGYVGGVYVFTVAVAPICQAMCVCVCKEFASVSSIGKCARKLEVRAYKMNLLCSKALSRGQTEKWSI